MRARHAEAVDVLEGILTIIGAPHGEGASGHAMDLSVAPVAALVLASTAQGSPWT